MTISEMVKQAGENAKAKVLNNIARIYETVSIHTKKSGKIKSVRVPYLEQKNFDLKSMTSDIKALKSAIGMEKSLIRF